MKALRSPQRHKAPAKHQHHQPNRTTEDQQDEEQTAKPIFWGSWGLRGVAMLGIDFPALFELLRRLVGGRELISINHNLN